jgi:YbbR domain-containing protein
MSEKQRFTRILYNDNFVKIFSIVAAVLFWFIVVINVSPDYKGTIFNVKVNINENASALTTLGLHAVDESSETVNISVSGPRNVIGHLSASDFTVTPSIGMISKAGSYKLELNAALKSPDNRVTITKVDPSYITVRFDTMQTKNLPVIVKVQDNNVPNGYLMQSAVSNPAQITVSGPSSELSQVTKAVTYVKIGDDKTKTTVVSSSVVLLNDKDEQLVLNHVQLSTSTVEVTVPILKTKDTVLKVGFSNLPAGFDAANIAYTVTPNTIAIAGEAEKIDSISEISLGNIDFTTLDLITTKTLDIPELDGIMNVENVTSANVSIQLKNISSRVMTTGTFRILNEPSGYKVTQKTKQITNIKLFGPSSGIESVTALTAVIDMSGVQSGTGQYEVPVTFEVPGKSGYWVPGSYKAVVNVSKNW